MLPVILKNPELRCQAHSRRSGWLQCGRLAAYGSRVCTTHGARKTPRFGADAPNFKHGKRSLESTTKTTHSLQKMRLLVVGASALDGNVKAVKTFSEGWLPLLERQDEELVSLRERIQGKRKG